MGGYTRKSLTPIKPRALSRGDAVGIVAPASPVHLDRLEAGIEKLERAGFEVVEAPHLRSCLEPLSYLAGSDEERAGDLMLMFKDPFIRAIICARGGYGCSRILNMLDYELIRENPKIFLGFSDITALHLAMSRRSSLVTFHGPGVESFSLGDGDFNLVAALKVIAPLPKEAFRGWIGGDRKALSDFRPLVSGRVSGKLLGGNLSLLVSLLGTPYEVDTRDTILFLEDVGEEPYKIDRMLQSLKLAGKLDDAAGFILGETKPPESWRPDTGRLTVDDVFEEVFVRLGKPCGIGFPCGHGERKVTLPEGIAATLDVGNDDIALTLDEAAVI
jgi:muramoyltetrapeptide carboxypeptidase